MMESQTTQLTFDPMLGVHSPPGSLQFIYDHGVFGPQPEFRRLDDIRRSLRNSECDGPDPVYSIAMDVGRHEHLAELKRRMLLFGVVVYAGGQLGDEPVRSQGHTHAIAPYCGGSSPELFEIWEGRAIIYAQESASDNPGRCFAITANQRAKVVVPPGWAHTVINADPQRRMMFGAWCIRQYGFAYDAIRARHGLAWYAVLDAGGNITWEPNPSYRPSPLSIRSSRAYPELGLDPNTPIYEQFAADPDSVQWVSRPGRTASLWPDFEM